MLTEALHFRNDSIEDLASALAAQPLESSNQSPFAELLGINKVPNLNDSSAYLVF
jgi:hypothetical protein